MPARSMRPNRSMPRSHFIPVPSYPDVEEAIRWLCDSFGFTLRWRAGTHRAQLKLARGRLSLPKETRAPLLVSPNNAASAIP